MTDTAKDRARRACETCFHSAVTGRQVACFICIEREITKAVEEAQIATANEFREWATESWDKEVKNRPGSNIYREMLDRTWSRMIEKADEIICAVAIRRRP